MHIIRYKKIAVHSTTSYVPLLKAVQSLVNLLLAVGLPLCIIPPPRFKEFVSGNREIYQRYTITVGRAGLNEREAPGKVVTARPPKRLA